MANEVAINLTLNGVEALQSGLNRSLSGVRKLEKDLTSMGKQLTVGLTLPILGIGTAAVKMAGDMEQSRIAFGTLLGSAEKAGTFLKDLADFASKTPFGFTELQDAAKRLMALGFNAEQVIPVMTNVGDAVAALGGRSELIDRITLALGQMQAKGKVSAQEMNQLAEAGIPAWAMLANKIGVSIPEAMKLAEKGAISSSIAIPAILEGMNQRFGGMMAKQSNTLLGIWSNLQDSLKLTLVDIGSAIMDAFDLKNVLGRLVDFVNQFKTWFSSLSPVTKELIIQVAALTASIGPLALAVGGAIKTFRLLDTTLSTVLKLNPYILAIGGLITAGILLYENWDKLPYLAEQVWGRIKLVVLTATKEILVVLAKFEEDASGMMGRIIQAWLAPIKSMFEVGVKVGEALRQGFVKGIFGAIKEMFTLGEELGKSIAEGQKGPLNDAVTFLQGKINEQQGFLIVSSNNFSNSMNKIEDELQKNQNNINNALRNTQGELTETGNTMRRRVIPEFFNLASVQRDMAQNGLPKLKSSFVTLKDQGLTPAEKAFGNIGITTSLVGGTFFPKLTAASTEMTTNLNKDVKEVITTQSLYEKAVQGVAESVKGIWNGTTTTFKDVWHGALDTFVDVFAQMVIQAQATGAAISVSMAAATAGISLVIGLVGSLFGGKKSTIKVEPLTDRLKKVFDDFVQDFKSAVGDFAERLFPAKGQAGAILSQLPHLLSAIPKLYQVKEIARTQGATGRPLEELTTLAEVISSELALGGIVRSSQDVLRKSWDDLIVTITKKLSDNLVDLSGLMLQRFDKIKNIVGDILGLYQKQKDFTKDMNKSITDVQRALLAPSEMLKAQIGDVDALKIAIGKATGDGQIALLGELKEAYLAVWGTAQSLFSEDTAALLQYQKFTVDGLESVKQTGKTAYDQLIDVNLEMLGVQRDGRDIQSQMSSYLSSLDSTILKSLEAIKDMGTSGKINEQQLAYIASAFSQLFDIPKMAHGGIVSKPTLAMIGEAGTEAVVPLTKPGRASQIMQEAGLAGGNNSVIVNNNFKGPVVLDKISMSKWGRELSKIIRRENMRYA